MWKQKIGISVGNRYRIPAAEMMGMLKQIGFDAVSPEWQEDVDLDAVVAAARAAGLYVQSIHGPFDDVDCLWSRDESKYGPAKEQMLRALADCVRLEIPVMVSHVWIGFRYQFDGSDLCFDHFDEIVDYAARNHIMIAFENTEGEEYLDALMEHYWGHPAVGFCWDSGHEMCYNHSRDLLADFGDRLLMTHINDNLGVSRFDGTIFWTDDLHLLPYDGIGDWDENVRRLRNSRKMEYLNFELTTFSKPNRHENDVYAQMSPEVYFTEAYKRACRIAFRYAK